MTLPPTDKTDKTDKTRRGQRSRNRQIGYAEVLRLVTEAIDEVRDIKPAELGELWSRHRSGEWLSPWELRRIEAALSPAKRARGRPIGSGAVTERRIVQHAIARTFTHELAPYRNPTSRHRLTKADAIAVVMNQRGFRRVSTYEAVAAQIRKNTHELRRCFAEAATHLERLEAGKAEGWSNMLSQFPPDMQNRLTKFLADTAATDSAARAFQEKLDNKS